MTEAGYMTEASYDGIALYTVKMDGLFFARHTETHYTLGVGKNRFAAIAKAYTFLRQNEWFGLAREIEHRVKTGWTAPVGHGSPLVGKSAGEIAQFYSDWLDIK